MIAFEALNDRLAHQIVGAMNIRFERDGRRIVLEVPADYVGGLRGLIQHETYGFEIRPDSGKVTTEESIGVGTRRTPMTQSRRILKATETGERIQIVVARYKEPKTRNIMWL